MAGVLASKEAPRVSSGVIHDTQCCSHRLPSSSIRLYIFLSFSLSRVLHTKNRMRKTNTNENSASSHVPISHSSSLATNHFLHGTLTFALNRYNFSSLFFLYGFRAYLLCYPFSAHFEPCSPFASYSFDLSPPLPLYVRDTR